MWCPSRGQPGCKWSRLGDWTDHPPSFSGSGTSCLSASTSLEALGAPYARHRRQARCPRRPPCPWHRHHLCRRHPLRCLPCARRPRPCCAPTRASTRQTGFARMGWHHHHPCRHHHHRRRRQVHLQYVALLTPQSAMLAKRAKASPSSVLNRPRFRAALPPIRHLPRTAVAAATRAAAVTVAKQEAALHRRHLRGHHHHPCRIPWGFCS